MRQLEGEHVPATQARDRLSDLINRAAYGQERIILTRRGKPVAALVPVEDVQWLEDIENESDLAAAREARKEMARDGGKTVPWEEVKREGTVPLDEVLKDFDIER